IFVNVIVGVIIVVVFGIVVVGGGVSSIFKLSFVIVDSFSCYWSSACPGVLVVDLTGDEDPTDEDVDIGLGDLTGVLAPSGDEISLGGKRIIMLLYGNIGITGITIMENIIIMGKQLNIIIWLNASHYNGNNCNETAVIASFGLSGLVWIIREQRISAYNGYEIREYGMRMYEGLWVLFIGKGPLKAKVHKPLRRVKVLVMEVLAHGWSLKWVKMKENKSRFWATTKIKTVNGERQIQALVDKKKVIITESSIRSDLHLEDANGTDCLPTPTIFEELARIGSKTTAWNEFSSTIASAIICLATNQKFNLSKYIFDAMLGDMSHHKKIYVNPSHTKKIFANMKREGKDFSGRTPITIQPSTSKPQKKQSRRKQKKNTEVPHPSDSTADVPNEEHVPTHSNDPLLSGEDRMKLTELMDMCTKLSERVLDLEHTKTAQAQEITNLKLRVKKLEKKAGFRTHNFKRLYKVGVTRRVESSDDESLGAQEDASKQGRSRIEAIDRDAEVTLVETQRRNDENDDNLMFDTGVFDGDEIVVETEEPVINAATTTKSIPVSTDEIDLAQEITLAQALAAMKSAKPKEKDVVQESSENVSTATTMVSTATTTVVATPAITTPPPQRSKGIAFIEPVKSTITTTVPSQKSKDKGKEIMIKPEKPLKKKGHIELDEELAREIEAEE
ncbi:hypothetical protein Tco_0960524, partial [Tanacetum coccineum]